MSFALTIRTAAEREAAELAAMRAGMVCSRLQGRLTLGPVTCAALDAIATDPDTPWLMRQAIDAAIEWRRDSDTMAVLGATLGYTPEQMDQLFEAAAQVKV